MLFKNLFLSLVWTHCKLPISFLSLRLIVNIMARTHYLVRTHHDSLSVFLERGTFEIITTKLQFLIPSASLCLFFLAFISEFLFVFIPQFKRSLPLGQSYFRCIWIAAVRTRGAAFFQLEAFGCVSISATGLPNQSATNRVRFFSVL